ncbi:Nitrogenase FeMo-cofactor scaffold and assembly protein NifE [Rhodovastum atsumiense]|nr:Nitrogenase FeMo-cofactor scaffold and assembly protein NifE [Rhodovastum atsumiense]
MALQPIADVAHLVHGPASCEAGSWQFRPTFSSGPRMHRVSFTTGFTERDTIAGGERKLARAIDALIARHDPPAVFVYQTCLPAMIGDDIVPVCRDATRRWGRPVIPVDVPGFAGSRPYGVHRAAEILMEHVIGTAEPDRCMEADIVLIGEFNLADELAQIRPLLAQLGIRVLASLTGDGRLHDIAMAHRARAAVLLCSQGLAHLAERMHADFGIPCIDGSFHGTGNIAATLRQLSHLLVERGVPRDLPHRAEALIAREERRIAEVLGRYRIRLAGRRAMLLCGGAKTWSVACMLKEIGMVVSGTAIGKTSEDDRRKVTELVGTATPRFDGWQAEDMDALLRRGEADIVLGGANSQFVAMKAGIPWLEINHERSLPLAGYGGMLALLAAIDRSVNNPVWIQVRSAAPWDAAG